MRIASFIIALLLLGGAVEPTAGWLTTLVVLTGLAAMQFRFWAPFRMRPALDLRLASFIVAALLLAGAMEAEQGWLILLSVVTGLAAFMPGLVSIDQPERRRWRARSGRGRRGWQMTWGGDDWP